MAVPPITPDNGETHSESISAGTSHTISIPLPSLTDIITAGKSPQGILAIITAVFTTLMLTYPNILDSTKGIIFLSLILVSVLLMFFMLVTQSQITKSIKEAEPFKRKILEEHLPELLQKSEDELRKFFDTGRKMTPALGAAPPEILETLCHHISTLVAEPDLELERFFLQGKRNVEIDKFAYQLIGDWMITTDIYQDESKDIIKRSSGRCSIRKGDHRLKISGVWVNELGEREGVWEAIHVILDTNDVFQFEFQVPIGLERSRLGKIVFSNIVRDKNDNPISMRGTWGLIGGAINGRSMFTRMPLAMADELNDIESHRSKTQEKHQEIFTLQDEVRAFRIVLSMLKNENFNINRIFYRDMPDFFQVMVDDNDGAILCKFYFNGLENRLAIPGESEIYVLHELGDLEQHKKALLGQAIKLLNA